MDSGDTAWILTSHEEKGDSLREQVVASIT
jgi:hypothetical protein